MKLYVIALPLVAAGIGWFTNFLAVRMIFRPHRPRRFLGFTVQGLLPKRRAEFAESIGATVEDHLVSTDDITRLLEDPSTRERLDELVDSRVSVFLEQKLVGSFPMAGAFLRGPILDQLKATLSREVGALFAAGLAELGTHIDEQLDFKEIVRSRIEHLDVAELERIVLRVARKELVAIEVLGAVLGFLIGLAQLALLRIAS